MIKGMTVKKLIELFPVYEEEIENLTNELACGCSLCVWRTLLSRHSELSDALLPDEFLLAPWG